MTTEKLIELLSEDRDDFLAFAEVKNKRSKRRDLHAFLLLEELVPDDGDIVSDAEHNEIFVDVDLDKLAAVISEEQVTELIRCGIRLDDYHCGLAKFV